MCHIAARIGFLRPLKFPYVTTNIDASPGEDLAEEAAIFTLENARLMIYTKPINVEITSTSLAVRRFLPFPGKFL